MELESWELLDLTGEPLTGLGELRLIWALEAREQRRGYHAGAIAARPAGARQGRLEA